MDAAILAHTRTGQPHHRHDPGAIAVFVPDRVPWGPHPALCSPNFAFTLVGAVVISAINALTLSADDGEPDAALASRHEGVMGTQDRHLYRREVRLAA